MEEESVPLGQARKFATDVAVRLVFQALNALKGLLYLPLISRPFGAEGYGIWSQIIITVTLFSPILTLRLGDAIVRYLGSVQDKRERRQSFFSAAISVWLISLATFLFGLLVSRPIAMVMFNDSALRVYVLLFLGYLIMQVNLVFTLSYYRSMGRIKLYSGLQTIQIIANLVAISLLTLFFHRELVEILGAFVVIDLLLVLGLIGDIARREGFSFRLNWSVLSKYLRYSLPLVPTVALYWIINSGDRYVIVHFLGLEKVAIYSGAYRLAQVLKLFLQPISFVLLPLISQMWEAGQRDRVRRYMEESLRVYLLLAIPASVGLIAVGPKLLLLLTAESFEVSQGLVGALVLGIIFVELYQIYVYIIFLHEHTRVLPPIFLLVAALNVGLNIALVPVIGILGAALTTLVSYLVQWGIIYRFSGRLMRLSPPLGLIGKSCASSGVMYALLMVIPTRTPFSTTLAIVGGVALYFGMMLILRGFNITDLDMLLRIFGKRE